MKKILCCIGVSLITALSANSCLAADTSHDYASLRISSGRMDNPSQPLQMTVLNTSDKTIHLEQLSLSNAAAFHGWKLSHDACSGQALLPQQSCRYSIVSSSNEAGNHVTVTLSASELTIPVSKEVIIPYPQLKVAAVDNHHTLILKDHDTHVLQITNTSPYIAIPAVAYRLGNASFAKAVVTIKDSCGKLLGPSASCSLSFKTDKITPELTGRETPLTITANGNTVLSTLNLALNDPEQLQFSVAPRQYPAFEDIVVTNTNADSATIKYIRMTQGTDISFKDHPGTTDPDTTPVCKFGVQLATDQQCHIWLHAKTGALSLSPNNFQMKITYNIAGNKLVKEIDGDNRSVLYLGGTGANGKPLLAAYNGFAYESFADLTNNTSPNATFPDGDSVLALTTDANGTLYFGGSFSDIQNSQTQAESVLNNIGAWSGSDFVALNNNLKVGVDDTVRALSYDSGSNVLYLGGDFSDNSPLPMNYVASYYDGAIRLFDKKDDAYKIVNAPVHALSTDGGSKVYMGGDFYPYIIRADLDQDNPFENSNFSHGYIWGSVFSINNINSTQLYAGGAFGYGNYLLEKVGYFDGASWNIPEPSDTSYSPWYQPDGPVFSILRSGNMILLGGEFSKVSEIQETLPNTAGFDMILLDKNSNDSGHWLANVGTASTEGVPAVYGMLPDSIGRVYIAGHFDSIDNGISAENLAVYDTVHNSFVGVSNSPFANGAVRAMAIGSVVNVTDL